MWLIILICNAWAVATHRQSMTATGTLLQSLALCNTSKAMSGITVTLDLLILGKSEILLNI